VTTETIIGFLRDRWGDKTATEAAERLEQQAAELASLRRQLADALEQNTKTQDSVIEGKS
jgi:prefoldin subunit 5